MVLRRTEGAARQEFEHRLVEQARRLGMRILGPECLGVVNTDPHTSMQATVVPVSPRRGRIGWSSQSGAIGLDLLVARDSTPASACRPSCRSATRPT